MDGPVYCHARTLLAGRFPAKRPGHPQGAWRGQPAENHGDSRRVAALAGLRCHAPLEIVGGKDMFAQVSERTSGADSVIYYTEDASPIGPLLLTSDGESLTGVYMSEHRHGPTAGEALSEWGIDATPGKATSWVRDDEARPFREVKAQLAA